MDDLKPIGRAYGRVQDTDVRDVMRDLGPGIYLSADLYQRYADMVCKDGRVPGHPTPFGRALREYGLIKVKKSVDGKIRTAWNHCMSPTPPPYPRPGYGRP